MEFMSIKMELDTKVNGKTIYNTDLEKKFGPTTVSTRVIIRKEKNTVRGSTSGKMVQCITVTGVRIELKDMENTNGKMAVNILGNGKIITCTVKDSTLGQMVDDMKDNMKWTKNTVLGYTNGQMVESTKEIGSMGNNMVEESMFSKMEISK